MPHGSPILTRIIRFYYIEWTLLENGQRTAQPTNFLRRIFRDMNPVQDGDGKDFVIKEINDEHSRNENESCWVLFQIRNKDFPQICDENGDNISRLPLDTNKRLCDPNHFMIFNDGRILGTECNRQSKDVRTALRRMIHKWIPDHPESGISNIDITPISKKDIDLNSIEKIRKFTLRSSPTIAKNLVAEDNSFSEIFADNIDMRVEISLLGNTQKKRGVLSPLHIIRWLQSHLIDSDPSALEDIDLLKIEILQQNGDGRYEEINLLDNYLVTKKPVVKIDNETKGVDSSSMFEQIAITYEEYEKDIILFLPQTDKIIQ